MDDEFLNKYPEYQIVEIDDLVTYKGLDFGSYKLPSELNFGIIAVKKEDLIIFSNEVFAMAKKIKKLVELKYRK